MSNPGRNTDELVDDFVAYINATWAYPLLEEDVPARLRTSVQDGFATWTIIATPAGPWVQPFKERLALPLPRTFDSLISRYEFLGFEVGPVEFFSNTGERLFTELQYTAFSHDLSPTLLPKGFVQFGRAAGGNYDPICFDSAKFRAGDAPVVQLDHEAILIRDRIRVVSEIAPSFTRFVERAIAGEYIPPWKLKERSQNPAS